MSKDHDLDQGQIERLDAWLGVHVARLGRLQGVRKFPGGQSNPTYLLEAEGARAVLRRKPFGPLLPKAHMIEREYAVMAGLAGSGVPVPEMMSLCEDDTVIGSAFYVMEWIDGRIFWDPALPDQAPADRAALYDAMNHAVAQLHQVRPETWGLQDYGRSEGFMARQVKRWTAQYRAAETGRIAAMEQLIDWLPARVPADPLDTSIFHGDLRMNNMIFHPREPKVLAILDWELSTLGDPIADLAYHAITWRTPPSMGGLAGLDLDRLGIPDEGAYLRRYFAAAGGAVPDNWPFYLAFSLFRVAAIAQGIAKRAQDGNASADDAAAIGARAAPLADLGWSIASASQA